MSDKKQQKRIEVEFVGTAEAHHRGSAVTDANGAVHPRGKVLEKGDRLLVDERTLEHPQGRTMFKKYKAPKPKKSKKEGDK
jgi:hypothetical protein